MKGLSAWPFVAGLALQASNVCAAPGCSVVTQGLQDLNFGVYDTFASAPLDAAAAIAVACAGAAGYTIELSTGLGSYALRTMRSGSQSLAYNLYTEAARVTVWGDGTSGTAVVSGAVSGPSAVGRHTIYGRIPPGQLVPPASYRDRIRITVSF